MQSIDWLQQLQLAYLHPTNSMLLITIGSIIVAVICSINLIVLEWLNSVKIGYCNIWYLNHRKCCGGLPTCPEFVPYFNLPILQFLLYIVVAIALASISMIFNRNNPLLNGSGLPQLKAILSGLDIKRHLNLQTALYKSQSALFLISSGVYLSYQEVLVHISCSVFYYLCLLLNIRNEATKRALLSVASCIGIAIGFNSNMGGILFSLEEASFYFPVKSVWKSFIGCFIATTISKFLNPNPNTFTVNWDRDWHLFEIPFFMLLGGIGGGLGALFIHLSITQSFGKYKSIFNNKMYVLAYIIVTNICIYFNKFTVLNPFFLLNHLYKECGESDYLLICQNNQTFQLIVAFMIIFISTVTSYGHFSGGYYVGVMIMGALYGRVVGMFIVNLKRVIPIYFEASCSLNTDVCITPGLYALIGSASMFTGVTKNTVFTIIVMMELSGKLNYIIPMLIAVISSKYSSDYFIKHGLTMAFMRRLKYPCLDNKLMLSSTVKIKHVMVSKDATTVIRNGCTLRQLYNVLNTNYSYFPVIHEKGNKFMGMANSNNLTSGLLHFNENDDKLVYFNHGDGIILRPWMDASPMTVNMNYEMGNVVKLFQRAGLRYLVVLDRGEYKGMLGRSDLIKWINESEDWQ